MKLLLIINYYYTFHLFIGLVLLDPKLCFLEKHGTRSVVSKPWSALCILCVEIGYPCRSTQHPGLLI